VTVDIANPVNGECQPKGYFNDTPYVYDIIEGGQKLYLAAGSYVTELSLTDPAYPTYLTKHLMSAEAHSVAVTDNGAIFAGLYPHGLQILYQGATRAYLPDREVSVDANGPLAYVGTDLDLQVLNANKLGPPLPADLPIIGRYSDYGARFYYNLAAAPVVYAHSPMGLFEFRRDLLLRTRTEGLALNGTPLPSSWNGAVNAGDRVGVASPGSSAQLSSRCDAVSEPAVAGLGSPTYVKVRLTRPVSVTALGMNVLQLSDALDRICEMSQFNTSATAEPPALLLALESGGLQLNALATGTILRVDTANANSKAGTGARFEAGYDPDLGESQFVCLAGSVQVQPTAVGAPLLTLGPGQYVYVNAAGAGPTGQYRYVYLPLALR
jgi:hypothetical protein